MDTRSAIASSKLLALQPVSSSPLKRLSILLVEDDPHDVELFRQCLSGIECSLAVSDSPLGACQLLGTVAFDLVFLDLLLVGGSSGLEVLSFMEAKHDSTSVVVLTGAMSNLLEHEIHRFKVFTTLLKPATNADIVKVLKQLNLWNPLLHCIPTKKP